MRDIVLRIGFLRASLLAGVAFFTVACIAAVLLFVFLFNSEGWKLARLLFSAIGASFVIGAVLGYSLLYGKKSYTSLRVLMIGILVPALACDTALLGLGVVEFLYTPQAELFGPKRSPFSLLNILSDLAFIFLFGQLFTGWLTYPCGIAGAYFLSRLGKSSVLSEPKVLGIMYWPKVHTEIPCATEKEKHNEG